MKTLEAKLEYLEAKQAVERESLIFKHEMEETFKGFDMIAYVADTKCITIRDIDPEKFNGIIEQLPVTSKEHVISYAGKDDTIIDFPVRFNLENPTKYEGSFLRLIYTSNDIAVRLEIPIFKLLKYEDFNGYFIRSERKIYDSEYHYFTGVSMKELMNTKIPCYIFNGFDNISWYGGSKTLKDVSMCENIFMQLESLAINK